ncbi:trehalose-phosphatase [Glycomyces albidus]|jgi:trehalose-phosphatase|uniref:Trehalose-phosphatase n=1 Tax=Glycomyces albidus TaxID=2656774 RepID=A0A6L5G2C0_9ACTN|nr:trehalose-phosphatase [Glycomyces albidus]MQM24299.1 trehalose-phosphatase [Glycomyces albidus]MQM24306.1 trehalose-phosphatase [Glycomyces albidus]
MTAPSPEGRAPEGPGSSEELRSALTLLARVPQLLIACDYDGTLAPIVTDPSQAKPIPESVSALRTLANLPQTKVAVISGRALRDLAALSRLPSEVHLVGSHGSEFDIGFTRALSSEDQRLRDKLVAELSAIAERYEGARVEPKPAGAALHVREATEAAALQAVEDVREGPSTWDGVQTTEGKAVIDLSVVATHKGDALDQLRHQLGASAVLFLGDDVTDENAFAHLHGPDVGVRVGPGPTRAAYRISDPEEVAKLLARLVDTRRAWLQGESAQLIERHAMIADGANHALLTPDGRVTWMCHPKPDSGSVFADLLGGDHAGHFTVQPVNAGIPLGQRYVAGTMTVETRWSGLSVTDWLDSTPRRRGDLNATVLVREITGEIPVRITFAPRPEFGQLPVQLQPVGDDGLKVLGGREPISLRSPGVEWHIEYDGQHSLAVATVDLAQIGGSLVLEMRAGMDDLGEWRPPVHVRRRTTEAGWRNWSDSLKLPRIESETVSRSALTLKALCYQPTGAILAAGTTSLPEELGGVRNWDYRFCWIRDAAMTANALVDLGSLQEAESYFAWVAGIIERTAGHPERLAPLYDIEGQPPSPEAIIDTLPGYAGARPVRINNAASNQVQLDVFGPVAMLIEAVAQRRGHLSDFEERVMANMVEAVAKRWHEPDHGIWEARQAPRHHVYSKVMCWVTVDRALKIAEQFGMEYKPEWPELRDQIAKNVLELGWNDEIGAYTAAYGHDDLDAASLWIGLSGLLPPDDPRYLRTVLKIEAGLRSGPTVYRYHRDDGLPGTEGGFIICAAWLAEAYLQVDRRTDAEELFEQILACAGPTGLLPEQWDPIAERGLGNHPQAYSHLGLIRVANLLNGQAGRI